MKKTLEPQGSYKYPKLWQNSEKDVVVHENEALENLEHAEK